MSDYLSNLPVELIYKIFDNITIFDILGCLCLVNRRLRLISLDYPHFRLDLSHIKKKRQFELFSDQLPSISSQIVSLSLSDRNDGRIPCKIEHFFTRFDIVDDTFCNLKSLYLSHVDPSMWKSIKNHVKSLASLVSLSINLAYMFCDYEVGKFTLYLLEDILFMSIPLKHVYVRANNSAVIVPHSIFHGKQFSSVEYLTLHDIYIDLEWIYSVAPGLRTFSTKLMLYNVLPHQFHIKKNSPENLKCLSINVDCSYFLVIERLLYSMKKLTHLIIIADNIKRDMADGAAWERILAEIISFKFAFSFHKSTWNEEPIELDTFQSLFWLEQKQWYVACDRCMISGFSLLYSIPYFMNTYPWYHIKGIIDTKSTRSQQQLSLNNVNRFHIKAKLSIDQKYLRRLTNLQELVIVESKKTSHVLSRQIITYIDMSRITTLIIDERRLEINNDSFVQFVSSMSHLSSLSAPLVLIKLMFVSCWSNIRRLEILLYWPTATTKEKRLTSNEIDAFYRSFTNIECLSFWQDLDLNLSLLLTNVPRTTSNILIHHPYQVTTTSFHGFVTRHWLEQNTRLRHFHYSLNELNLVSLWL